MHAFCHLNLHHARREKLAQGIGIAYLILLALRLQFWQSFYVEDFLAPLLLLIVLWRWCQQPPAWKAPLLTLGFFLLWAGLATLWHPLPLPDNVYHLLVFAYLALVFLFFRNTFFPPRFLLWFAVFFLTASFFACLHDIIVSWLNISSVRFSLISLQMEQTSLSFLRQRFTFHFGNPNLYASFHALPLALFFLASHQIFLCRSRRSCLAICFCAMLFCFPLLFTISKHSLLSLSLFCHFSFLLLPVIFPWSPFSLSCFRLSYQWLPLILLALLFALSVLYPVFPLQRTWPFINTSYPGMYMIHQNAYARMAAKTPMKLFFGHGAHEAKNQYPAFTDRAQAALTLQHYNATEALDSFVTFMDPHNQYLHLLILFGAPAMVAMTGFWLSLTTTKQCQAIAGFAVAVLICCLWDDLLSKRWVWITAAMLTNSKHNWTAKLKATNGNMQE